MIVPMKKLSLLLYHQEREKFLAALADLGVIHIEENIAQPSEKLTQLFESLRRAERIAAVLRRQPAPADATTAPLRSDVALSAEQIMERYESLDARHETLCQEIAALKKDCASLQPWGEFDPATLQKLAGVGVKVRFFETTQKAFAAMDTSQLAISEISRVGSSVFFVLVELGQAPTIDADELLLPATALSTARAAITQKEDECRQVETQIQDLGRQVSTLVAFIATQQGLSDYERAMLSMEPGAEGTLLNLTGWLPAARTKDVAVFLDAFPCWFSLDDPAVGEPVPVQMHNSRFAGLFEPITKIFSLPDYFEIDPTPFFAPFFAFFFGLCLGDVGYGMILLILSLALTPRVKKTLKPLVVLMGIFGLMTMLSGLLLNTFFGEPIFSGEVGQSLFQATDGRGAALLTPVATETGTMFPAMPFAIYLGLVQILLGMLLKGINQMRLMGARYFFHPLANMLLTIGIALFLVQINFLNLRDFSFGILDLGEILAGAPSALVVSFLTAGLLLLLLFNNPAMKFPGRLGMGFWELYQYITSVMGDGLSYLRLFALGLAGGLLGAAFNQIAFMFITNGDGVRNWGSPLVVATIVVLILGHTINFALASLGAFVHPLRLTFVEFYKNINFKGGSSGYSPFRSKALNN